MDTFMDKLAQKLNAQEMIKANSAADAEEMDQLKSQLREYDECLAQMQQVNKELKAINQEMEKLMSDRTRRPPKRMPRPLTSSRLISRPPFRPRPCGTGP